MKKIMFNDKFCLTQAVLDGTKTMTRRSFARFEPDARMFDEIYNIEGGFDDKGRWIFTLYNENGDIIGDMIPRYNVGEVVAIAQPYKDLYSDDDVRVKFNPFFDMTESAGWNNKLFVESQYMKHHIKITDVKVERLQDISDDDIMREGIRKESFAGGCMFCYNKAYIRNGNRLVEPIYNTTPRRAFASLMYKISGKGTWESNPWVVAYSFELVD